LKTARPSAAWLLLPLIGVAVWLRVRHLGALGLVVDEGNQALAIRGILEHGIPVVDSGLVYARNALYMAAQALSAWLLGLDELSLRLPSVVFGVAVVAATYALGLRLLDRPAALLAAALMAFSAWEIELSRYARFYTTFQFFFVAGVYCFYRAYIEDRRRWRPWFWVATLCAFMSHELGGLLAVCFLVPVFLDRFGMRRKLTSLAGFAGTIAAWVVYRKLFDVFRKSLESVPLEQASPPAGALTQARLQLGLPGPRLPDLQWVVAAFDRQPWIVSAVALGLLAVAAWLIVDGFRAGRPLRAPLLVAALVAGFFQLFAVAVGLLVVHVAFFVRGREGWRDRGLLVTLTVVAGCLVFWLAAFTFATDVPFGQAARKLFAYPDLRNHFFHWLSRGWPVAVWLFAVGSFGLLIRITNRANDPRPLYLLAMVFVPLVLTSAFRSYHEARYVFHLYPLVVLVIAGTLVGVGRRVVELMGPRSAVLRGTVAAVWVVLVMFGLRDSDPRTAWAVGSRDYDSTKDVVRAVINWSMYGDFHQDHKTPAEWVVEHRAAGDRTVALGPSHMIGAYHYYLGNVTHLLGRPGDAGYYRRAPDGRIIGWVTGSEVLNGVAEIEALKTDSEDLSVWLLADDRLLDPDNAFYNEDVKTWLRAISEERAFVGRDGRTFVVELR
jgi:hypothetical protein